MPTYTTGTHTAENWDDSGLPASVREYLATGAEKGKRNLTIFWAACQFRDSGFAQAKAETQLLARGLADGLPASEILKAIKSAYSQAPREAAAAATAGVRPKRAASSPSRTSAKIPPMTTPLPSPIADGFRIFLETVFEDGERVAIGQGSRNGDGELIIDRGDTRLRKMWLKVGLPQTLGGVFSRINPMQYRGAKNDEVTAYRHALVEFDLDKNGNRVPKEIQYTILLGSPFPISTIVDSGNKSLQALVRVEASDKREYGERVETVFAYFRQYEFFDDSNKAESKYCRLPGCERQLYDASGAFSGTAPQQLLAISIGPANWAEYEKAQQLSDEDLERLTRERQDYYDSRKLPFPLPMARQAYYGIAGEIVDIIRPNTEACPESILVQVMLGLLNMVGRRVYRRQAGVHCLNEFVVLAGPSKTGCKGASWDVSSGLLETVDPAWFDHCIHSGIESGEGVISWVRDDKYRITHGGKRICIPGVSDKRLLIFEDEFPRLLMVANRQNNTLSPTLREVFDGRRILETGSKNDPERATGALISLLGHGVPEEIRNRLSAIDAVNGFANRILFIAVQGIGEIAIPPPLDWLTDHPQIITRLKAIIATFQTQHMTHLGWTSEGEAAWEEYYRKNRERKFSGLIDPFIRRSLAHTLRWTMGFCVLDGETVMRSEHLQAAISIIEYSERSAQWIFGEKIGDKDADKIFWELDRRPEGMSLSEIYKEIFGAHHKATEIKMKLQLLREGEFADFRLERSSGAKRPTERWFSNRYL